MSEGSTDSRTSSLSGRRFELAGWTVDPLALTITKGDETRRLEAKTMALLVCLASRPGEAMTRRELEDRVWPDVVVGYGSLTKAIIKLRQALGDDTKPHRIIETVPKVGYRLIAEVESDTRSGGADSRDQDTTPPGSPQPANAGARTHRPVPITPVMLVLLLGVVSLLAWRPWAPDFEPVSAETMAYPLPDKPSIAVLPFDNLTGDPEQEYLSDGLTENITTALARFRGLFVIARYSTLVYKDDPVKIQQVARDLGVRYVLEGSVQIDGDRVRVTAQLNDAIKGAHVWADQYDDDLENVFQLQDEITQTIVVNLRQNVQLAEFQRVRTKPVENLEAYELFNRAYERWLAYTEEGNQEAKQMWEKVIEMDPSNLRAHAGLALVHLEGYRRGWSDNSREESLELAFKYARKAAALDPASHNGHWIVGKINRAAGNYEKAAAKYKKAIELNPNDPELLAESSDLLVDLGQGEEAISRIQTAMRLNPRHPDWYYWSLGWAQYAAGQCGAAVNSIREMSNIPTTALRHVAAYSVCAGRVKEAQAVMQEFLEKEPGHTLKDESHVSLKAPGERWFEDLRQAGMPE